MPRRTKWLLFGGAAGVALLLVVWYGALHVGLFERLDRSTFFGFTGLPQGGRLSQVAEAIAHLCNPNPWVFFAAIPIIVAVSRHRPRMAFAIATILVGANMTTQLLKIGLVSHRDFVTANTWPSGHATAAMSLALSAVLASSARWRPWIAAVGAAFAVAVSYSFLALGWHYPSDVLGGFLVAGTWTLFVVGAVFAADARWPRGMPGSRARELPVSAMLWPPTVAVLSAAALVGLVALVRPHAVITYASAHAAFMIVAAGIGVLALTLATGLMLALRASGSARAPTGAPRRGSPRG